MEERIGLGGKGGQGGEAALAKARVTRLEAEVMTLKKGSTPGEGVEAEVVVLRRQMAATLQRRMGMGIGGGKTMSEGGRDGVEGRLAACMEELEEYRAKYAQALDVIGSDMPPPLLTIETCLLPCLRLLFLGWGFVVPISLPYLDA